MPRQPRVLPLLLAFVLCTCIPESGFSQSKAGGSVFDETGRPVASAVVILLDRDGTVLTTVATGADGRWLVPDGTMLPAAVDVSLSGFKTTRVTIDGTALRVGAVRVELALAPRSEQIVVTAAPERAPLEVLMDAKQPRQPVPAHDGAEYLQSVPGFSTVRKGGSGGDPVFRGMAGSRLAVLTDGATILGGCSARMDAPTAYVFPETYDLITVIKGPQTVKYGAVASAGTVLFERDRTRLSGPSWLGTASATAGSWGRHDEVFDVRAGTARGYVRGVGSRSAMGDYRDGDGVAVHSQYMRWSTDAIVGWTPDASTTIEAGVSASDGRAAYADRSVDGSKFQRTGTSLLVEKRRPGARLSAVSASASYNVVDHIMDNYTLRTFQASATAMSPSAMNPDRTTYGGRVAATWTTTRLSIDAGVDTSINRHRNRSSMAQDTTPVESLPRVSDAHFATVGTFAEIDYRRGLSTRIVGGARIDRATGTDLRDVVALSMMTSVANPTARQTRTDVLPSGFARVEQRVDRLGATLYVGLGRTARVPDYWELMTKESATSVSAFATRPEVTTQLDAGLQAVRGRTSYRVSAFANRIRDFILIESNVTKAGAMGMTRAAAITRNVDAATMGTEAGLAERLGGGLTVDAALAYVRGTNRTDQHPLAQMPPLEGRLSLQFARGPWSAAALARVAAAQHRVALNQGTIVGQDFRETSGFEVFSANAGWRISQAWQLTAGVDNLLNATYAEHIGRQGASIPGFAVQTQQVREPGRTAWIRLSARR